MKHYACCIKPEGEGTFYMEVDGTVWCVYQNKTAEFLTQAKLQNELTCEPVWVRGSFKYAQTMDAELLD